MAANFLTIDSYSRTIAAAATAESISDATVATAFKFARDVVIHCPAGNTTDIKLGNRTRQGFTIAKGTSERLSTIMNNMSQSGKFRVAEIFVKAGTDGDKAEILLVAPSND